MQTINIDIDLSGYSPQEVIKLVNQEVISVEEVEKSGRATSCFTHILSDFLRVKRSEEETMTRMVTVTDRRRAS